MKDPIIITPELLDALRLMQEDDNALLEALELSLSRVQDTLIFDGSDHREDLEALTIVKRFIRNLIVNKNDVKNGKNETWSIPDEGGSGEVAE